MKKITAFLLTGLFVVCGVITPAAQAEHYGPVRSFLAPGELSLGLGLGVLHDKWSAASGGDFLFRQKALYAKLGFGLGKDWALGFLAGAEDLDSVTSAANYSSGAVPFIGASVGGPLYRGKILSIGPVAQASYVVLPFDSNGVEIENMLKASAALLAQVDIEGASLYFGPTITFGDASGGDVDLELRNGYAGIIGVRWLLPDNWPTSESKTFFDLELGNDDFQLNRSDLTVELNFTF
jgi:hypothetical protein